MNCSGRDLLGQKLLKVLVYLRLLYCFVSEGLFFSCSMTLWNLANMHLKLLFEKHGFKSTNPLSDTMTARESRIFLTHMH